jgi:hypothetical protein
MAGNKKEDVGSESRAQKLVKQFHAAQGNEE